MADSIDFSRWIPIFPLPNAVLLPRAILPLHVFEARYRAMTRDAVKGPKLIAIALLKRGYEKTYELLDTRVWPEVCVGRILRAEQLADGRFNLLLQGVERARICSEDTRLAYRRGRLSPIHARPAPRDFERTLRAEIHTVLSTGSLREFATEKNWLELFHCPDFTFSDLVDVLASAVLPDVHIKQRFLAEPCVLKRAKCIRDVLTAVSGELARRGSLCTRVVGWPPTLSPN